MAQCLIVDDSKVIRKVARHIIESFGMDVAEAEDGQVALNACRETEFDLVLLDWNMPVMGGMEFLVALNESDMSHRPKIVFCTTENSTAQIRAAIEAGADEYVMKPFDRDTLERKFQLVGVA
jgi:two-component system, chemotaxis family, chemotaxis protein CheY